MKIASHPIPKSERENQANPPPAHRKEQYTVPPFPSSGKEQSLQYGSIAYECGWGAALNHLKSIKITFLHDFAVGTVSLFPPYTIFVTLN